MPTYIVFNKDPIGRPIDAPDMIEAAKIAARYWALQSAQQGSAVMEMWAVDVANISYGEVAMDVQTVRNVTVTPKPLPPLPTRFSS